MHISEKGIKRMLRRDCLLLAAFLLAALGFNSFILVQTVSIAETAALRGGLIAVFAVTMLVLTGSILWVGRHLLRNRDEIYGEDLHYQQLIRQQKEGGRS